MGSIASIYEPENYQNEKAGGFFHPSALCTFPVAGGATSRRALLGHDAPCRPQCPLRTHGTTWVPHTGNALPALGHPISSLMEAFQTAVPVFEHDFFVALVSACALLTYPSSPLRTVKAYT